MKRIQAKFAVSMVMAVAPAVVQADVNHHQVNHENLIVTVSDDPWQPDGFENGTTVPAVYVASPDIVIDGQADESAWERAATVEIPLSHGDTSSASLKAVYSDDDVFIRVRWADDDENREHHPWIWNADEERYVAGTQVEDSVMLSFEAGCEWSPSFLDGYIFDFDGWHWLAARSDPLGQALDLYGNVQDRAVPTQSLVPYASRNKNDIWNMKFTNNVDPELNADWDELDRVYMLQPVTETIYYQGVPDGRTPPPFVRQLPPPDGAPAPRDIDTAVPQFVPVKLEDGAGEVEAKGHWEDGYWTVEFRRKRVTPAKTLNDTVFNRMVQFSVHVFDRAEKIDEASLSDRLFLKFLPAEARMVSN